jgi:hypothetical protein
VLFVLHDVLGVSFPKICEAMQVQEDIFIVRINHYNLTRGTILQWEQIHEVHEFPPSLSKDWKDVCGMFANTKGDFPSPDSLRTSLNGWKKQLAMNLVFEN